MHVSYTPRSHDRRSGIASRRDESHTEGASNGPAETQSKTPVARGYSWTDCSSKYHVGQVLN